MAAPDGGGSPLSMAVIGVENMAESLGFYRGIVGMDVVGSDTLRGLRFAGHWRTPPETRATAVLLQARDIAVGRILLVDFFDPRRERIRARRERRMVGLKALDFCVRDIAAVYRDLSAKGYEFWWPPRRQDSDDGMGRRTAALLEGPDGVILHLMQLHADAADSCIGRLRASFMSGGATPTGFSPVAASAHGVRAHDRAVRFFGELLGMATVADETLGAADERTQWTLLQGAHAFGMVSLAQPLNYRAEDLTPFAVAPNVGYLAQAFEVPDLDEARRHCGDLAVEIYSPPDELMLPGLGPILSMLVRDPGSGALQQLYQTA